MIRGARNVLAVLLLGAVSQGCSPACDTSDEANEPIVYTGGTVTNGIYESSSVHGPLLDFRGGRRYDLFHHLGFEPIVVQVYWSFRETGVGIDAQTSDTGSLTLGSGNSAESQLINDQFVRVKNDSCVDFWARFVAFGGSKPVVDGGDPLPDAALSNAR